MPSAKIVDLSKNNWIQKLKLLEKAPEWKIMPAKPPQQSPQYGDWQSSLHLYQGIQQSTGIETLFKGSADKSWEYANDAYKTVAICQRLHGKRDGIYASLLQLTAEYRKR